MHHTSPATMCENSEPLKKSQTKSSIQGTDFHSRWRGLRWQVMLGVLPQCPAPIEELRRAAANGRRRYAEHRRRLLVDPHIMEEIQKPNHLGVDNPLSQDPESAWGRYFQNAEVERTINKDLTRLYPEHESFFQSPICQAMLRRILLVWSLIHPHYSYRQGMHELLAPLLYVLYSDTLHLSELKQKYDDLFHDRFDDLVMHGLCMHENERTRKGTFLYVQDTSLVPEGCRVYTGNEWRERIAAEDFILLEPDEFGFDLRVMVLGSDTYGAEGELGCLLSQRFIEHDAYCMFDSLMSGEGDHVVMAEYFMSVTATGSAVGLSPVLEASSALYQALAATDFSLYLHLVGLGIEPQFFALRWLRLLFGREFVIDKLLLLWDAILAAPNTGKFLVDQDGVVQSRYSHRSTFISSVAVSMLLYLRPALLAAPDATSCLQKLLNFPETVDIKALIDTAKLLQSVVEEAVKIPFHWKLPRNFDPVRFVKFNGNVSPQGHNKLHPQTSCSPEFLKHSVPDSYWEEQWRSSVLQKSIVNEPPRQENMQSNNKVIHKKSLSHDSTVLTTDAASGRIRQSLSVEGDTQGMHLYSDDSNKVAKCKILCGTTEEVNSHLERFMSKSMLPSEVHCQKQDMDDFTTREGSTIGNFPPFHGKVIDGVRDPVACHHANDLHEDEEEDFISTSPFSQDGTSIEYDDQSSTSSVASEDGKGNSPPLAKSKSSATGSHTGKLFWLWNLGKRQSSDRAHFQTIDRASNSDSTMLAKASKRLWIRNSSVDPGLNSRHMIHTCTDITSNTSREADGNSAASPQPARRNACEFSSDGFTVPLMLSKNGLISKPQVDIEKGLCNTFSDALQISKQGVCSSVLQILGQSILDNVQVLETVLCQRTLVSSKEGLLGPTSINKETATTLVIGKVPDAAVAALSELRKISNLLLQM